MGNWISLLIENSLFHQVLIKYVCYWTYPRISFIIRLFSTGGLPRVLANNVFASVLAGTATKFVVAVDSSGTQSPTLATSRTMFLDARDLRLLRAIQLEIAIQSARRNKSGNCSLIDILYFCSFMCVVNFSQRQCMRIYSDNLQQLFTWRQINGRAFLMLWRQSVKISTCHYCWSSRSMFFFRRSVYRGQYWP